MHSLKHWILHAAGIALLEIALVAALAVSLAQWTWVVLSPHAAAATTVAEQPDAQPRASLAARQLFGVALEGAQPAASTGGGLALLGVFSGRRPGAGRAIFSRQGSRPVSVAAGESIADGLVLREVHPDHVIILRDGAPERIDLERRTARAAPPPVARLPAGR
jgi:Type II secretion system protein C